ncbi:MAG: hypothetical protein A3K19_23190 [Lentisphaerae bacterium RIFOXYB12_FULL_65_16]|nr:MAG: hypothetical protein A3K18_30800 [Lentisphaerae bacterium RIFOXYA12_64_32]OGV90276.1 MAG: hypothetical protein A3K19_23190 [Lentisphaerae bacterium RIFOXYB12_FULL_65_16]
MDPSSLVIDPQSPVPIYYQAALQIRDLILKGALVQDEKLPTEHELAAALGINRLTARNVYRHLEKEGLLTRSRAKGSFVSLPENQVRMGARKNVALMLFLKALDSFLSHVTKGIEEAVSRRGCNLVLQFAPEDEAQAVRDLVGSRPDGILWMFWDHQAAPRLIREIQTAKVPLVLVDSIVDNAAADFVGIDIPHGIARLTRKLADAGHRRITLLSVGHPNYAEHMLAYEDAFRAVVLKRKLPARHCPVLRHELPMTTGPDHAAFLDELAARRDTYDAVILQTMFADPLDYARHLFTHHAETMKGIEVGLLLSDAHPKTSLAGLPLVYVLRRDQDMGREAGQLIADRIEGKGPRGPKIVLLQ